MFAGKKIWAFRNPISYPLLDNHWYLCRLRYRMEYFDKTGNENIVWRFYTAQKMNFFIKDVFYKREQTADS